MDCSDTNDGYFRVLEDAGNVSPENPALARQPLAREVAVAFCYNGVNHAVMMATPEALEDFAVGFSVSGGIVQHREQIIDLDIERHDDSVMLNITLNQRAFSKLRAFRRSMTGASGCGLCGIEALSQALTPPKVLPPPRFAALPPVAHLSKLRQRLQRAQQHRHSSGAMHAALYVDTHGKSQVCREDIGRHNALDKLIGGCLREEQDLAAGFVVITSRCSLELIQKCLRTGVGTLVSLASPSDIAVRWARRYHLNLVHQPAQGPARVYSGAGIESACCVNPPAGISL